MNRSLEADIATAAQNAAVEARQDQHRSPEPGPPRSEGRKKLMLGILLILLLATTAVNLLGGHPLTVKVPKQTPEQRTESRARSLDLQREWVEGYRSETGRLPAAEDAATGPWRFVNVDGQHYQLVFVDGEDEVVHSSGSVDVDSGATPAGGSYQ